MNFADLIVIAIVALLLWFAVRKIYLAKKSGAVCMGCPSGGGCSGGCSCNSTGASKTAEAHKESEGTCSCCSKKD